MSKRVRFLLVFVAATLLAAWALFARGPGTASTKPGARETGGQTSGNQPTAPAGGPARPGAGPAQRPAIPVKVAGIEEHPLVDEVTFVAAVQPSVATSVSAEVEGRVVEMAVREGDPVVAWQTVIARLDAGPREIQLREAKAAVARAREEVDKLRRGYREEEIAQRAAEVAEQHAILERAEADYRRGQRLHAEQFISQAERQRWESEFLAARQKHERVIAAHRMMRSGPRPEEIAQAEADLAQAQARADRIADDIRRTTVRAAITGHVVRKHVDVGAWPRVGDKIVDLIALDPVYVTGPVGEREVPRVRLGQAASVTVDALPGRPFRGKVSAIVPEGDPASRTFPVRITVENPGGVLKGSMFARVALRTGDDRKGLFLPKDAVVRRGGQQFVFLVENGAANQVKVETGPEIGGLVEIRGDGLVAGRSAVTLGNEFLQPGMKVTPQ